MNIKCRIKTIFGILLLKFYYPKVSFRIINKPAELEKMYKLIWQIYGLEKKYINQERSGPESLKDEYEEHAIKIGAFIGNNLIGTLRIILPSEEGFYVEKDFNVELPKAYYTEMAELSRLVVPKKYRNGLISFGLLKKALEISKKRKVKYWIVVIPEEIKNYFANSFGINFYPVETKELTEKQIRIREKMSNYYVTCAPAPYLINLLEI